MYTAYSLMIKPVPTKIRLKMVIRMEIRISNVRSRSGFKRGNAIQNCERSFWVSFEMLHLIRDLELWRLRFPICIPTTISSLICSDSYFETHFAFQ